MERQNPCKQLADFLNGFTKSESLQVGLLGGITYSSYIESNGSGYQVSCQNTINSFKLTNIQVKQRLTGNGFGSCANISTKLDPKTGVITLKDIFGNCASINLPIPDGKKIVS